MILDLKNSKSSVKSSCSHTRYSPSQSVNVVQSIANLQLKSDQYTTCVTPVVL
ncbi:hypothetical protein KY290_022548 [Solanum tuberosum]|uniref:Uncharacterized protein n=1 Tax=Solanum tuberosum TaxID=4113 RepID=A0ABQ7V7Q3_SOLTU|nr:hypothetical protein KY284_021450 [Solanum tuberosum]KAH0759055.1 hypothetical protein KY290_022548 [Solanum tuberosum]